MKQNRSKELLIATAVVHTIISSSNAIPTFAQSTQSSQQSPSFLRQAGQMIFDNAQKRMINRIDQNLQNQSQNGTTVQSGSNGGLNDASNGSQYNSSTSSGGSQNYGTSGASQNSSAGYGASGSTQSLYNNGAPPVAPQYGSAQYQSTSTQTTSGAPTAAADRRQSAPCRSWVKPGEQPIACLLCIHGLGLQSNSYEFFGKEQSNRGLAVYAIDVRGFGSWMNAKGKTKVNFDECLEDIKQTLESIRAANPGLPVYVLGESMGGAIALRAASMYPSLIDGLVSSVPASERFNQGRTSMKVFLNLISGVNIANIGNDLVNQATKNDKLKAAWQDDPLSRLNLSPQELIQFQDFMNFNHDAAKKVTDMPVLFVQGTGDQLVKPEGTWELFNDVASKDKSFFAVPGEHLIFEEAQTQDAGPRDQNFRIINSWLSTKVGRRFGGGRRGPGSGGPGGGWNGSGGPGGYGGWNGSGGGNGGPGGGWNGPGGSGGPGSWNGPGSGGTGNGGPGGFMGRMSFINTQGLEHPLQLLDSSQNGAAISELEQLRSQKPTDSNVLALLGRAYFQNGEPDKASQLFRRAMRIRRGGGDQARSFNSYLLSMAGNQTATNNVGCTVSSTTSGATQSNQLSRLFGLATNTNAAALQDAPQGKAKVLAFYSDWADQCKSMNNSISQLSNNFGNRVDITKVNIDDSANDSLVDQYKIGPIPTVVFLSPSGKVGSTIIGESTYDNYAQALNAASRM